MDRQIHGRLLLGAIALLSLLAVPEPREFARRHGAKQRLSIATSAAGNSFYIYGGGIARTISAHVPDVEVTAEVTGASVDNLVLLRDGRADLALTQADVLADAFHGRDVFASLGRVPARSLAHLFTLRIQLVTWSGSGIERISDLKGRIVSTGAAGSGTEIAALRILEAAGLKPDSDLRRQALNISSATDALRDEKIDAFFQGGGVQVSALADLARTPGRKMHLVSSADVLPVLQQRYGPAVYREALIPRSTYPGMEADVRAVSVGALLVVDEQMSEQLAYEITRALFEHQAELAAVHPEGKNLRPETAILGSPVPFHPGAVRYYRERGLWNP